MLYGSISQIIFKSVSQCLWNQFYNLYFTWISILRKENKIHVFRFFFQIHVTMKFETYIKFPWEHTVDQVFSKLIFPFQRQELTALLVLSVLRWYIDLGVCWGYKLCLGIKKWLRWWLQQLEQLLFVFDPYYYIPPMMLIKLCFVVDKTI